jgi:hypothetical protein
VKYAVPPALSLLLQACSLFVDADRDRLGPAIDIGGDCAQIETCDDGVACTNDFCDAAVGECVHEPSAAECGPEQTCDPERGCVGGDTPCSGDEDCRDESGCTVGRCDGDRCVWDPIDGDQDGTARCDDCDDGRADVHPGGAEVCGNGADDDCNGAADGADPACEHPGCGHELVIEDHGQVEAEVRGNSELNSEQCLRGDGPEAVVELILLERSDLVISTEGSEFDTVLYVREGCDGAELACADNRSQARGWLDSHLFLMAVPAGTYTIVVDAAGRGGRFQLRVDREDPRAPSCDRPLDISGGGTAVGRTEGDDGEAGASCSEPTGPAAAFSFDLDGWTDVTIASDESDYDLVQDVAWEQCGGDTAPGGCLDQTETGETFRGGLEGGRWIVVLDGFAGASGRYVLRYFP